MKIVLAYDGSEDARRALDHAAGLAARNGSTVRVVSVAPLHPEAGLGAASIYPLDQEERRVPDDLVKPLGERGALYAMMLDQRRTFDELIERYATDPVARDRLMNNRMYRQISATLSGAHEYAAMAKLRKERERGRE